MSGESIRDRLSALSRAELSAVVVVAAVTLGGAGLWYVRSLPRPVEVMAEPPAARARSRVGEPVRREPLRSSSTSPAGSAVPACTSSPTGSA